MKEKNSSRIALSQESAKVVAGWEIPKNDCGGSLGCRFSAGTPQHVCCIYENEENHNSILKSYLLGGILENEKILLAVETEEKIEYLLDLLKDMVFVETEEESEEREQNERSIYDFYERGQLVFLTYDQSYLLDNCFVADRVAGQIKAFAEEAEREGYSGCRLSGIISPLVILRSA